MTFSRSSLELFAQLLAQVQLPAMAPDLEEVVGKVVTARQELSEALKELPIVLTPPNPKKETEQ